MIEIIKVHQLNMMLSLSSICATIAIFVFLTGASTKKKRALQLLAATSTILLMSDRAAYIYDGNPTTTGYWMVRINNFLDYSMTIAVIASFNFYLKELLGEIDTKLNKLKRIRFNEILLLIGFVLIVISQFTGLYYTFDETNTYQRGTGFVICYVLPVIVLSSQISINIQFYKRIPRTVRHPVLLFSVIPFFSSILQMFVYGLEAINMSIVCMSVLLYIFDILNIRSLEQNNDNLKTEVAAKNEDLIKMQEHLITSMAMLVESRDNSTGGHILRTREVIKLIINEIKQDPLQNLPEDFCRDILKAAPMHDLGKIAVDDAILRKPGKFTAQEFEIMKTHAEKGAVILHNILKDTKDTLFQTVAENMAHYHHERWDGSGYPKGLKGEEIPLEARIMAIADVYDALVSKRVYKEIMSFEEADKIIMDGMGKQFDKSLEKYYIAAREKLEAYYKTADISE